MSKYKVLIAGIGGGSLGTELLKCLKAAKDYIVLGCDISRLAYGHYISDFHRTYWVDVKDYINSIMDICINEKVEAIIPGGEQPLQLLNKARSILNEKGICLAANSPELIKTFTDKGTTFQALKKNGFSIPLTIKLKNEDDFKNMNYPCVIKPSTGSGGSDAVVLMRTKDEALRYWRTTYGSKRALLLQEYIPIDDGEFSIGVLSLPNYGVYGSIALKKIFESKISIHSKNRYGIISSPYSSGLIDEFAGIRRYAESIALAVGSTGPLNIQGRMRKGILMPFEINPRFSGSEYIRTMAGFNQLDIFLKFILSGDLKQPISYRHGYYLRSLTEMYVPLDKVK